MALEPIGAGSWSSYLGLEEDMGDQQGTQATSDVKEHGLRFSEQSPVKKIENESELSEIVGNFQSSIQSYVTDKDQNVLSDPSSKDKSNWNITDKWVSRSEKSVSIAGYIQTEYRDDQSVDAFHYDLAKGTPQQ